MTTTNSVPIYHYWNLDLPTYRSRNNLSTMSSRSSNDNGKQQQAKSNGPVDQAESSQDVAPESAHISSTNDATSPRDHQGEPDTSAVSTASPSTLQTKTATSTSKNQSTANTTTETSKILPPVQSHHPQDKQQEISRLKSGCAVNARLLAMSCKLVLFK